MVETTGFVRHLAALDLLWLGRVLETLLSRFFPPLHCCPVCWLWHEYLLSLFNLNVIDNACVVFAAEPPP